MRFILPFIVIGCLFSCRSQSSALPHLDQSVYNNILAKCPFVKGKVLTIYYLNGSCSICIAKAAEIEKKINGEAKQTVVFIATTESLNVTKFNFENIGIKSCLIIDDPIQFGKHLPLNTITQIDPELIILKQESH